MQVWPTFQMEDEAAQSQPSGQTGFAHASSLDGHIYQGAMIHVL